jgi:hypothetical protein
MATSGATVVAIALLTAMDEFITRESTPTSLQVAMLGQVALETASAKVEVRQVTHWLLRIFEP